MQTETTIPNEYLPPDQQSGDALGHIVTSSAAELSQGSDPRTMSPEELDAEADVILRRYENTYKPEIDGSDPEPIFDQRDAEVLLFSGALNKSSLFYSQYHDGRDGIDRAFRLDRDKFAQTVLDHCPQAEAFLLADRDRDKPILRDVKLDNDFALWRLNNSSAEGIGRVAGYITTGIYRNLGPEVFHKVVDTEPVIPEHKRRFGYESILPVFSGLSAQDAATYIDVTQRRSEHSHPKQEVMGHLATFAPDQRSDVALLGDTDRISAQLLHLRRTGLTAIPPDTRFDARVFEAVIRPHALEYEPLSGRPQNGFTAKMKQDYRALFDHLAEGQPDFFADIPKDQYAGMLIRYGAISLIERKNFEKYDLIPEEVAQAIVDSSWLPGLLSSKGSHALGTYHEDSDFKKFGNLIAENGLTDVLFESLLTSGKQDLLFPHQSLLNRFDDHLPIMPIDAAKLARLLDTSVANTAIAALLMSNKDREYPMKSAFTDNYIFSEADMETIYAHCGGRTVYSLVKAGQPYHGADSVKYNQGGVYLENYTVDAALFDKMNEKIETYLLYEEFVDRLAVQDENLGLFLAKRGVAADSPNGMDPQRIKAIEQLFEQYELAYDNQLEAILRDTRSYLFVLKKMAEFDVLHGSTISRILSEDSASGNGFVNAYAETIANNLQHFTAIDHETIEALRRASNRQQLREYPRDGSERARDEWFADMSYVYMSGGFSRAAVGRVIRLRVEHGLEKDVHDASQWLSEFQIPEHGYDVQSILRARNQEGFDPESIAEMTFKDWDREQAFFLQLAGLPVEERSRLNLSGKKGVAEQMFDDPGHQFLYHVALQTGEDGMPHYKSPTFSISSLVSLAQGGDGQSADTTSHIREFVNRTAYDMGDKTTHAFSDGEIENVVLGLEDVTPAQEVTAREIARTVGELRAMGQARQAYATDTQAWLRRHTNAAAGNLTKVWRDRGMALAYGVDDRAGAIASWQRTNAVGLKVRDLEATGALLGEYSLTAAEVLSTDNAPVIAELSRRLSADNTIEAMSKLKRWKAQRKQEDKLLPPAKIEVKLNDSESASGYSFEVLDKDDPRGFTIGEDTGCCMTIHGASNSCISAGYRHHRAGFVALYAPDDSLAAQSFWYVHPKYPGILVLDNIETNEGRDIQNKVLPAYREALREYFDMHPETGITDVHIGTGYSDVDLGGLPRVEAIPPLSSKIYTDAHSQRLLMSLNDLRSQPADDDQ